MRVGLSVYGTMYGMGIDSRGNRPRITPIQLIEKAHSLGLEGVEIPTDLMHGAHPMSVVRARKRSLPMKTGNCFQASRMFNSCSGSTGDLSERSIYY